MTTEKLLRVLKDRQKGTFINVTYRSNDKPRAEFRSAELHKVTQAVVRFGIKYGNMEKIRSAIAEGLRGPVKPRSWGEWVDGFENILLQHKGNYYLNVYPSEHRRHTWYYVNGIQVSPEAYQKYLRPSDQNKKRPTTMTVNIDNIISLGK